MQVEWSPGATRALQRRIAFLRRKNPRAAGSAVEAIFAATDRLAGFPHSGRRHPDAASDLRELIVAFGSEGYVLLYQVRSDRVLIVRVKHQREGSY